MADDMRDKLKDARDAVVDKARDAKDAMKDARDDAKDVRKSDEELEKDARENERRILAEMRENDLRNSTGGAVEYTEYPSNQGPTGLAPAGDGSPAQYEEVKVNGDTEVGTPADAKKDAEGDAK